MANRLKMATVEAILALAARGWSQRRIARELGVNRETVGRYVGLARRRAEGAEGTLASSGGGEGSASATLRPPEVRGTRDVIQQRGSGDTRRNSWLTWGWGGDKARARLDWLVSLRRAWRMG